MRLTGAVVAKSIGLVRGLVSAMALAVGFNAVFSVFGERSNTPPLHGGWEPMRLPPLDAAPTHAGGVAAAAAPSGERHATVSSLSESRIAV